MLSVVISELFIFFLLGTSDEEEAVEHADPRLGSDIEAMVS